MKKIALLGFCFAAAFAVSAQTAVLKEAERDVKAGKYDDAMAKLKPAMNNAETKGVAQTWFLAGKAGVDYYQDQFLQKQIGKEVNGPKMGHALVDSYGYLIKALPLDSLPNEKGKIKPKYSKDIIKMVNERFNDLNNAAVFLWDGQDYQGAYDAWDLVINLPSNKVLGANAPKALADSTLCDIVFNQGLAAWQMDSLAMSLKSFEKAIAMGYDRPTVFDYAINHAARLQDNEKVYQLAEQAYRKFGNVNPIYLQLTINGRIEKQKYDEANKMIDEALALNPADSVATQLYNIKGLIFENMGDKAQARSLYEKASTLSDKNAEAFFNLARLICDEAYTISDKAQEQNLNNNDYAALRQEKIDPLFKQAAVYLEKAIAINPDNNDVRTYLRNVYYNLGDEENLKRVESM